jgi:branched-chain amino acid aminotransferase
MQSWHFIDGRWVDGNPAIIGPNSHALWLGSCVFDGARAFEGVAPDLDLHCVRVLRSARAMGLAPHLSAGELLEIAQDGIARFPKGTPLYVRPMFWAEGGFVTPDPATTRFCFTLHEAPMPEPKGFSVMLSSFRRPHPKAAPTDAKAACLYPNAARALKEAADKGFDNAVVLDSNGNVAELATANLWFAKDGVAVTPIPNGTFLNGITRQRVSKLLQAAGVPVEERSVTWEELLAADELFSSGNYGKVQPITRIEGRNLQPGPVYARARKLYWDFAHG